MDAAPINYFFCFINVNILLMFYKVNILLYSLQFFLTHKLINLATLANIIHVVLQCCTSI